MDEEMADFFHDPILVEEVDFDYEFDAARYHDFTCPETYMEAREAECWFESAGNYSPSPCIIKLNWKEDISVVYEDTSFKSTDGDGKNSNVTIGSKVSANDDEKRDKRKPKVKSSSVSRSSTLRKPTASQLAKLNEPRKTHCSRLIRIQKAFEKDDDKSSQVSSMVERQTTKRQKLEAGYLSKVAQLKHQALLVHKRPNKAGFLEMNLARVRPRVTIPKGPYLETARRAQRRRSKINAIKSNAHTSSARPLNKKTVEASTLPLPRKSMPQSREFQVFSKHMFRLREYDRAMHHTSSEFVSLANADCTLQNESRERQRQHLIDPLKEEKCGANNKFSAHLLTKKESKVPADKGSLNELPIELLSKLSLGSSVQSNREPESKLPLPNKDLKENTSSSFNQENKIMNMIKGKTRSFKGKQYLCGSDKRILEIGSRLNINRSLDIR